MPYRRYHAFELQEHLIECAAGQPSDIPPFAYAFRKGAANNPVETRWLNPTPDMLCGLLWEERRSVRRIEVEFPSAPATVPIAQELRLVTRGRFKVIGKRVREAVPQAVGHQAPGRR